MKASGMRAGDPDFVFYCRNGLVFFVELKVDGSKLTPIQRERRDTFVALGFPYYVIETSEIGAALWAMQTIMIEMTVWPLDYKIENDLFRDRVCISLDAPRDDGCST